MKKISTRKIKKFVLNRANLLVFLFIYLMVTSFLSGMFVQQILSKKENNTPAKAQTIDIQSLQQRVLPENGYVFKIKWGDLGKRMVQDGVIDEAKLAQAVNSEQSLQPNLKRYFDNSNPQEIELNSANAHFWVDVLWGLGLANKNALLEKGPMVDGGNTANFASTGGWTIGVKQPMEIYAKFSYIPLTDQQQVLVVKIAENIFRPCCGNSTAFPDCNHGMAALGLIELMVYQNFSEEEIYKTVLAFNSYWFPQTYLDIAYHFAKNGRDYNKVPASEILSKTFSSAMGYAAVKKQLQESGAPTIKQEGGCGA